MSTNKRHTRPGGRSRVSRAAVPCAALLVLSIFAGCGQDSAKQSPNPPTSGSTQQTARTMPPPTTGTASDYRGPDTRPVTVTEVVDGDTVQIEPSIEGRTALRLVGVNTPELDSSEPLAEEALDFTERELEGERVKLILGEESVDPYGRLLGTIMPPGDKTTHGQLLLERGYAQTLFYEPNIRYQMLYRATQDNARERQAGMWGLPIEERCELANHGNDIGASSSECEG